MNALGAFTRVHHYRRHADHSYCGLHYRRPLIFIDPGQPPPADAPMLCIGCWRAVQRLNPAVAAATDPPLK